ncbi:hypothetical protein PG993_008790 [Apiospora rasikravindrae]|uniref:Uncharacterized protein n=1 Tax=Apiospora rasikravindrae TaxID=990691 RepID=A0ABR1SPB7_9PEZI
MRPAAPSMRITRFRSFVATASITFLASFAVVLVDADVVSSSRDHHDRFPLVQPGSRADGDVPVATTVQATDGYADNNNYDAVYLQRHKDKHADETVLGSAPTDTDRRGITRSDQEGHLNLAEATSRSQDLRYGSALYPRDTTAMVTVTTTVPCSSASRSFEAEQQLRGSSSMTSMVTTTMNANNATQPEATTTRCTPVNWTNTFAFTTDAACPTPYENGTYCGFVNPEDPCAEQPGGHGPRMDPDTPEVFLSYAPFHNASLRAATPAGYRLTFVDLYAAANAPLPHDAKSGPNSRNTSASATPPPCYMGHHLLAAYDPAACAALCDADPSGACAAFNLYVERHPAWNPWRCSCDRPRAVTNYKCALFSGAEAVADAGRATNFGQAIQGSDFVRKIAGSNGYVRLGAGGREGGACQQGQGQRVVSTTWAAATTVMGGGGGGGPSSLAPPVPTSSTRTGATTAAPSASSSTTASASRIGPSGSGGQAPSASRGATYPCVGLLGRIVGVGGFMLVLLWYM